MAISSLFKDRLSDKKRLKRENFASWSNLTIADRARQLCAIAPDTVTHVDADIYLTVNQALQQAESLAQSLWQQDFREGDVLAFITPNWHEAVVINLAACLLGLVICPIVPIYRDHEVQLILADSQAKGIFVAHEFRGFNYLLMMQRLRSMLPNLQHVWTVRGKDTSCADYFEMINCTQVLFKWPEVSPNSVKLVLYTSGTTGHPKAVLHSHNTLSRAIEISMSVWGIEPAETTLMPSPVTHVTGYSFGLEVPFFEGSRCVLMDKWDAAIAVDIIEREKVAFTLCATPFLQELLNLCEQQGRHLPSMRRFPCGGAAVPPELIYRVRRVLTNCMAFRVYGSSEAPFITLGYFGAGQDKLAAETDGEVYDYEIKLVNPHGLPVQHGSEGEICVKGLALFLGYLNSQDTESSFDSDGFFHTGDIGIQTPEGALVFTGRIKDLINRGGEKISAKEVEDLLHGHPAIAEAAVVAMPHARLGETLCAYVIFRKNQTATVDQILERLEEAHVARQKLPEKIIFVDDFPKTASGKVKKDLLRLDVLERLRADEKLI